MHQPPQPPLLFYLTQDYNPEHFLHREAEIREIEENLFNDSKSYDKPPRHMLVFGDPGVGKTGIILNLIRKNSSNPKVKVYYVNTEIAASPETTTLNLIKQINPYQPRIENDNKAVELINTLPLDVYNIIVLDEIDKMLSRGGMQNICGETIYRNAHYLYPFIRSHEASMDSTKKSKVALVLIANDITLTDKIGSALMNSFGHKWTKFYQYTIEQVTDILADRMRLANCSHLLSEGALKEVAKLTNANIREALEILYEATNNALAKNKKITKEDIRQAYTDAEAKTVRKEFQRMNPDETILVAAIYHLTVNKKMKAYSTLVYEYYSYLCSRVMKPPLSLRHFRRLCQKNEINGILSLSTEPVKGAPIFMRLTLNTDMVLSALLEEINKKPTLSLLLNHNKFPEPPQQSLS